MVCLATAGWPLLGWTQSSTTPQAVPSPAAIRSADFIVAVVNSDPITNQEVQSLSQRLQREALAQGRPLDAPEAKRLALEQLINDTP